MTADSTGPAEVREHLNFIERLVDGADSSDEYLEAIIRNQAVMISLMEDGGSNVPEVGSSGIPTDTAGIAVQGASEGDLAEFLYKADGRTVIDNFEVRSNINDGEVATINSEGLLEPRTSISQGDLDFGNISAQSTGAGSFMYADTEESVAIEPGETKTVLEKNVNSKASWHMSGTNDETHTEYQYYVDGQPLIQEPAPKPLGLYNNMFEFPVPIQVDGSVEVKVTRLQSAGQKESYFSNLVLL